MNQDIHQKIRRLEENIALVVYGKEMVIRECLTAFFSGGHLLLEDVPGVGKTLLAQALARSLSVDFRRIQFTPDLLPADIIGSSVYDMKQQVFRFTRGPVFTNILLADEINRTSPRTQSAMLEAMSEKQVSVDGESYSLPDIFMVIATENPIEFEGTYPLPESQLDRFLMRISMGYPDRKSEKSLLDAHLKGVPLDSLTPVLTAADVLSIVQEVQNVRLSSDIQDYILDIVETTRRSEDLFVGVSTRGMIAFCRAVRTWALLAGRDFVTPDDVKRLAVPVLAHRVILKNYSQTSLRNTAETLIERLVDSVAVPV